MTYYAYVLTCIVLTGLGQVLLKIGARNDSLEAYLNPYSLAAYALLLLATGCTLLALREVELKTFYALMSANYVAVALLSRAVLKEGLGRDRLLATALIVLGIAVFNL